MNLSAFELDSVPVDTEIARSATGSLATHAALLQVWLARPEHCPPRWRSERFARVVDLVRAHLRPLATRELLALSYSREHFHLTSVGAPQAPAVLLARDATEVAYALRWLELGEEFGMRAWASLVGVR